MIYIFDLDGTLIDSMKYWIDYMRELLLKYNCVVPEDFVITVTPMGEIRCCEYLQELGVPESTEEILDAMKDYMIQVYTEEIPAKETVPETLCALKEAGHTLAVLTASPHSTVDPCLKRLGLFDLFVHVWSSDDFNRQKSELALYGEVAELLHVRPEECTFVDDNYTVLQTAKEAGMHVIGVYDQYSDDYRERIEAFVDQYAEKMADIL